MRGVGGLEWVRIIFNSFILYSMNVWGVFEWRDIFVERLGVVLLHYPFCCVA